MVREVIGQLLGWLIVAVVAWLFSLLLMSYGLGVMLPWLWTEEQRFAHLVIQFGLITAYAYSRRSPSEE